MKSIKLNIILFGWLTTISILGVSLFILSYLEDEHEEQEKQELEKRLQLIEKTLPQTSKGDSK